MTFFFGGGGNLVNESNWFVICEWVIKIDSLANRSTCWPVGWLIHQVQSVGQYLILSGCVITLPAFPFPCLYQIFCFVRAIIHALYCYSFLCLDVFIAHALHLYVVLIHRSCFALIHFSYITFIYHSCVVLIFLAHALHSFTIYAS